MTKQILAFSHAGWALADDPARWLKRGSFEQLLAGPSAR